MLEQLVIRDAVVEDAPWLGLAHAIAAEESYGHYFPEEFMQRNTVERRTQMWAETLALDSDDAQKPRVLVAESASQIVGFGAFGLARDTHAPMRYELWRLYVLSAAYGTGLATRMLHALDPDRTPSYLWVMEKNTRAIAFYRKHGYQPDGAVEHLTLIDNLPKIRMVRSDAPAED